MSAVDRRAQRSRQILDATRELFEERGVSNTQIEDIANTVGVNRAIIYRHFSSKEELFAMTLVDYLTELEGLFMQIRDAKEKPSSELRHLAEVFFTFGMEHPAFVDCAQALLRFRGAELLNEISPDPLVKLGASMNRCFDHMVEIFERGTAVGEFTIADPNLLANVVYVQSLGFLNLVHFQKSVSEVGADGSPVMVDLPLERVMRLAVEGVLAIVTIPFDEH